MSDPEKRAFSGVSRRADRGSGHDVRWYGRQVKAASIAAGVLAWTPHQLRHTRATAAGLAAIAAAAASIGDTTETTRRHYLAGDAIARDQASREG